MSVSPAVSLRYNLDGKSGSSSQMLIKQTSESALVAVDRIPRGMSTNRSLSRRSVCSVPLLSPSVSSSVLKCAEPFKVFVLLLAPRAKIFEFIQLIYSPLDTTVGDIIDMIPDNASEPALGNQEYMGFCRPNGGEEITDFHLLASGKSTLGEGMCARISRGEILIAMSAPYRGDQLSAIGKPILKNKKLVALLKRKDPLSSPKRRRRSRRSSSVGPGSVGSSTFMSDSGLKSTSKSLMFLEQSFTSKSVKEEEGEEYEVPVKL